MQPPLTLSSLKHHNSHRSIVSQDAWLNLKGSSSKHTSACPVLIHSMIILKFVSDSSVPLQPGYQEAHNVYNKMQHFFMQKAMSVHNGKVVVIKVTMMLLKPSNKNPLVVSVHKTNVH